MTVTCLMPGSTETDFFARAQMTDTRIAQAEKADAAQVAKAGFDGMMQGEINVVAAFGNKVRDVMAHVPDLTPAEGERRQAEPGSAKQPAKDIAYKRRRRAHPRPQ